MADTYTIQQVLSEEEWNGSDGTAMLTFKLQLENFAEPVFAYRPANGKKPQPGDEGTVDTSGKKPKFKSAKGWSGGSSNGASDRFDRKPDHPSNVARMRHSTALGAAPSFYEQMRTEGVIPKAESKEQYVKTVEGIVTWLEQTYPDPDADPPF